MLELVGLDDSLFFIAPELALCRARVAVLPRIAVYRVVGQRRVAVGTDERPSNVHFDLRDTVHSAATLPAHKGLCPEV